MLASFETVWMDAP